MVEITAEDFFALKEKFTFIPYSQSRNWHDYLIAKGESVIFYVDNLLTPEIAIMGKVKRIPIIGKVLFIEGELISDEISDKMITTFYRDITNLQYSGFEINSPHKYTIEYEIGIRRAGFVRPISLTSCPLSIIIKNTL